MDINEQGRAELIAASPTERQLHVGRPNLGPRSELDKLIDGIYERRWVTNDGPLVQELEASIAERLDVKHCIAMCNGTIALEIAIRALGLEGEVIVPSFTFVATAHALSWQGIRPVFADIDPRTHNLDPRSVEAAITPQTTGIIGVHLWGRPAPVQELTEIADRHGLALMFDAAHAFDCSAGVQLIGGFGRAETFSFHGTKFFNTFEGGAVTTNDDEVATTARLMRNFGFSGYDNVIHPGTNGKMSEISAAMGLVNLRHLEHVVNENRRAHSLYSALLSDVPGVSVLQPPGGERQNYQYVVAEVDQDVADRDVVLSALHSENVLARRYFWPGTHRMEPYASWTPRSGERLPSTELVASRVLVLPTGPSMSDDDVERVARIIRRSVMGP
ncbi:dTDP-4-dehydro-6-deoxyglucose aminotransferase [Phycicoccus sp. Root563]|uniref:DegT/DnrJ/EryC1/StrS family aminotransferase n=1 Tax=Phycicoccus sp. Root563 TaxID=1736562 RepID=UPI0007029AC0|nr:DegT/DnrJ/EryC1/StrS family aminotransferase [Phycicoccus sp. Root563]KQZ90647.1 dTDP-4-dehydro-6-deoxyglucose aminotransferase [Phycicoccus sp. Root563]